MAENRTAGDAAAPTSSSRSSSTSSTNVQRRKPLEDIISSPELRRRPVTSNMHTAAGKKHTVTPSAVVRSEGTAKSQKAKGEMSPKRSPTARRLRCEQEDDMAAQHCKEAAVPTFSATSSELAADTSGLSERDSLLERLREKEKQFDEKITTLDETLLCAERGRLQRDSIIDGLRAEVARLRAQLELAAGAKSQADEIRERILKERTVALEEAHANMAALHDKLREKDQQIKRLEKELNLRQANSAAQCPPGFASATTTGRVKMSQQQKQQPKHKRELLKTLNPNENALAEREREWEREREREREQERQQRERYASSLRALQEEVHALEQSYNITRNEKDALAEENHALRSKLDALQESIEARVTAALKAMQGQLDQKRELEAEVVATRLSMARLLRLLREVPEMRRYLQMNEIDGDMLFTGYTLGAVTREHRKTMDDAGQPQSHYNRRRHGGHTLMALGTGVDDGVYGGSPMLQSSNIYLNGQSCKQLQDLLDEENNFLRRRKICIGEIEEAARFGRGGSGGEGLTRLPPASDVLQGRQNDKDFWIPYAVFLEAQKFKNRYFPSLSYECFYPFLTAVNQVWNEKTKRRVAAETKRRLYAQQQQQQQQQQEERRCYTVKELMADAFPSSDDWRQMSSSALSFWKQFQNLRHEVRRRVTGKNSLELYRHYDYLVKCALKHLREVQEEHAALLEQHQSCERFGRAQAVISFDEEDQKVAIVDEEEEEGIVGVDKEASVLLRRALSTLVEDVQEVSERSASRIMVACRDLREFLEALREQKLRAVSSQEQQEGLRADGSAALLQAQTTDSVPVSTLLRIIEGVLDFVDEVQREVFAGRNAVSRCATRADEQSELLLISQCADDDSETEEDTESEEAETDDEECHQKGRRKQRYGHSSLPHS